jgi:hypothetical protein
VTCVFCSCKSETRLCSSCEVCAEYMLNRGLPVTRIGDMFWVIYQSPTNSSQIGRSAHEYLT